MNTTSMLLTDAQLVLLDGHVDEKGQLRVDEAKRRLADIQAFAHLDPAVAELISDLRIKAEQKGKLAFRRRQARKCRVCGKQADYAKYTRNTKYHSKGEVRFDKPLYMSAIDLDPSGVHVIGHVNLGCCKVCWEKHKDTIAEAFTEVRAELPAQFTGHPLRWKCWTRVTCKKCGWKGNEGQLGLMRAMMGGTYRGQCPACDAKTLPLGSDAFERDYGHFDVVPAAISEKS